MKPLFWFKLSILTLNLEFSTACVLTCCKSNQEALIISWVLQKVRETEPKRAKSRLCSLVHSLSELALARASCCWCLRKSAESCGQPARACGQPARACGQPARSCGNLRGSCGDLRGSCGDLRGSCGDLRGSCGDLRGSCGNLQGSCGNLRGSCWCLLPACSKVLPLTREIPSSSVSHSNPFFLDIPQFCNGNYISLNLS
jgi:hypothetical protein